LELVLDPGEITSAESARADLLERERYTSQAWNQSR